jgi:hypothetical protein
MVKHKRKVKSEEKELEQEITDCIEIPENVLEIWALLGNAAEMMISSENEPAAFSGRNGDFIFTLVYDPANKIDQEKYTSAILEVIKKVDPSAIGLDIPYPFTDEKENEAKDNV